MIEIMVESIYSSSNVYGVIDDDSNYYRSMVVNIMKMNRGDRGECLTIDKEPNTDTISFFDLLKYFD
jgi:hypothetical protein